MLFNILPDMKLFNILTDLRLFLLDPNLILAHFENIVRLLSCPFISIMYIN